jgi:hypothetical protein
MADLNIRLLPTAQTEALARAHNPDPTIRNCHHSKTITCIVPPDDFESEPDAQFAAEKMIRKL